MRSKLIVVLILLFFVVTCGYRYMYPYGRRPCSLRCIHGALVTYASEHHGKFPASTDGNLSALSRLYPEFTPSGIELAGLSGDIKGTIAALQKGVPLTENLSSWVYVQGFSIHDDPRIAILWESRQGLFSNGRKNLFGGRAVLLIGGDITNVPAADWPRFLEKQEKIRKERDY